MHFVVHEDQPIEEAINLTPGENECDRCDDPLGMAIYVINDKKFCMNECADRWKRDSRINPME